MKSIARVQTPDPLVNQLQTNIIQGLAPILKNPLIDGIILSGVSLISGDNTITHTLGRKLIGWCIVRQRAASTLYDKQDTNASPDKTLILNSSGAATIDIYVF